MTFQLATRALLDLLAASGKAEVPLNEAHLPLPDVAVAALVGGLDLARRVGPVRYRPEPAAQLPNALSWSAEARLIVDSPALATAPGPRTPWDPQVVVVRSEAEMNSLIRGLVETYGGASRYATDCIYWLLQEGLSNALRWSVDHVGYAAWSPLGERFVLAVGDSGNGIPLTSGAGAPSGTALDALMNRFDHRGRPLTGLTRLLEHWRQEVPHIDAYVTSGGEFYSFRRYDQATGGGPGRAGPTVVAARF